MLIGTRVALGLTGIAVIGGISLASHATRKTWPDIRNYRVSQCGMSVVPEQRRDEQGRIKRAFAVCICGAIQKSVWDVRAAEDAEYRRWLGRRYGQLHAIFYRTPPHRPGTLRF